MTETVIYIYSRALEVWIRQQQQQQQRRPWLAMLRVIYSSLLVVCSDIAHLSSAFAGTYLLLPVEISCLENLFFFNSRKYSVAY